MRRITLEEGACLLVFGPELRRLRGQAGVSRRELADGACLSADYVGMLERAERRPRCSTLVRMVEVLVKANPELGSVEELVDRLCELAGVGLAPETSYPVTVARTLARRQRRKEVEAKRAALRTWAKVFGKYRSYPDAFYEVYPEALRPPDAAGPGG